jgi:trk system potassium uptake protein TrkH
VTMRTAGFNTVDISAMGPVTLVLMLGLMFVGGSSGSTAGGVKTSTIAVVFLSVRAMLTGRSEIEVGERTIEQTTVYKAISIVVIFSALFFLGFIALLLTDPELGFQSLMFEAMSALATVGLSQGVTPSLSTEGRLVVLFLMFVGRIGPLTLALAISERQHAARIHYPTGHIMVG